MCLNNKGYHTYINVSFAEVRNSADVSRHWAGVVPGKRPMIWLFLLLTLAHCPLLTENVNLFYFLVCK